jgi:FdhD protein
VSSKRINIDRAVGASSTPTTDHVVIEEPLEIQVCSASENDAAAKSISITMRTPGHDLELALGFLASESIVTDPSQVAHAELVGPVDKESGQQNTVRIQFDPSHAFDLDRISRHFYTTSSCGVCGKASLDALRVAVPAKRRDDFRLAAANLVGLPDKLRDRQDVFESTGGLHAAAAFDASGELLIVREDVGRHNAVDKVVGTLFQQGRLPAKNLGLLVSGRASFELMQKTLVAGMPMLAAVSAPSSLAVQLAREYELTLVGFLRGESYNLYSAPERILRR